MIYFKILGIKYSENVYFFFLTEISLVTFFFIIAWFSVKQTLKWMVDSSNILFFYIAVRFQLLQLYNSLILKFVIDRIKKLITRSSHYIYNGHSTVFLFDVVTFKLFTKAW